jgi:hypothetical protein
VPMGRPAAAVAPTPVPGMRPYTAPGGQLETFWCCHAMRTEPAYGAGW